MSKPIDPSRVWQTPPKRVQVDKSDQRIHDAVVDCVNLAAGEGERAAQYVFQYVQELIKQGWTQAVAEQIGSRAIGVINAINLPPSPEPWTKLRDD